MQKFFLFVLMVAFLAGCVNLASEPQDGDRARLRGDVYNGASILINQSPCKAFSSVTLEKFVTASASNFGKSHNNRSIGMGDFPKKGVAAGEMYIRAGEQFNIILNESHGSSSCIVSAYFIPEKDHDYLALGSSTFEGMKAGCKLLVLDVTGGKLFPVELSKKQFPCN